MNPAKPVSPNNMDPKPQEEKNSETVEETLYAVNTPPEVMTDVNFEDDLDASDSIQTVDLDDGSQQITLTCSKEDAGMRLDKYICKVLDLSRTRTATLLEEDRVKLSDRSVKASRKMQEGDILEIHMPPAQSLEVLPEKMDLDIVYEDEDIIVINKPKGMVVHPAPGHMEHTLVNGLLYHCKDLSGINGVKRPGIVHRIDKDTSGLLVVAKNDMAHESLAAQLQDKSLRRIYRAIVHHPFSHTIGTVDAPIGRDEKDRQKMAVTAKNSKPAVTHFTVLENFKDYAYIECSLETGRTHQIRVHMAYIQHPVAGDPKYGPRKTIEAGGQLLHAMQLELIHPRTKEKMHFEAPLDPTFAKVLAELEKEAANA